MITDTMESLTIDLNVVKNEPVKAHTLFAFLTFLLESEKHISLNYLMCALLVLL